jgi:hypothetical protein
MLEIPSILYIGLDCHLQRFRDLIKLKLDLYNTHKRLMVFLAKIFLVSLCIVNGPYHYPSCQH